MTISGRKSAVTKGSAKLLIRILRGQSDIKPDWRACYKPEAKHQNLFVEFNTKDELELQFTGDKDDIPKINKENVNTHCHHEGRVARVEAFRIDEIVDCVPSDTEDFINTLVVETIRKNVKEDLVLKFDSEQEFRRTLFTYKYFKMRNRLANSGDTSDGSCSPSLSTKSKSSLGSTEASPAPNRGFDFTTASAKSHINRSNFIFGNSNNNGSQTAHDFSPKSLDYVSNHWGPNQKNKWAYDQKVEKINSESWIGAKGVEHSAGGRKNGSTEVVGEIDGLIYTDVEYESMDYNSLVSASNQPCNEHSIAPMKPQRRKQVVRRLKGRAPPPPAIDREIVKEQTTRPNVEKFGTKESSHEGLKCSAVVPRVHIVSNGYESDREEWRSRSTFSSSAFHSLARPARHALAAYYKHTTPPTPPADMALKPSPRNPRSLQNLPKNIINADYVILPHAPDKRSAYQQDLHQFQNVQQKQELKYGRMLFHQDYKKNTLGGSMNYLNISSKLHGITDKIKEIGRPDNIRPHWQRNDRRDKGQLKPVIKKSPSPTEGSKRPVVRTCSAEPPKKVTFSAFATVQVV